MGTPALSNGAYSPLTSSTLPSFQTFCIERSETFVPGQPYDYAISNNAIYGSVGAGGDPLSIGTAWLYAQFTIGSLIVGPSNYDYFTSGTSRSANAGLLQFAFWALEDELNSTELAAQANNPFYKAALANFGGLPGAQADANGAYGVRVLNLDVAGESTTRAQDQLYRVGSPDNIGGPVPSLQPHTFLAQDFLDWWA